MIRARIWAIVFAFLTLSGAGAVPMASARRPDAAPARPVVLPEAQETALALEAAPPELRAGAGLWVLTRDGYRQRRVSTNGYTCIVNRDDVESIKPTCYDREGAESILPAVVWFGDQLMLGRSVEEISAERDAAFAAGRFHAPRRAGIAFMLSPHIVNAMTMPDGSRMTGTAPPHYMIYAPNVTNEDLDLNADLYASYPWLPYAAYEGPHGFLIIPVMAP